MISKAGRGVLSSLLYKGDFMKKNPVIEPIVVMAIGLLIFFASFGIETAVHSIAIGPDFMPKLIGVLFVILGATMLPAALRAQKAKGADVVVEKKVPSQPLTKKELALKYMHYIVWVWTLLYALSMKEVGFLFSSIIYLFVSMILLTIREKKRNWLVIVLVSLIVPTFVYILFRQQFFLMLPVGICKYIPINILR